MYEVLVYIQKSHSRRHTELLGKALEPRWIAFSGSQDELKHTNGIFSMPYRNITTYIFKYLDLKIWLRCIYIPDLVRVVATLAGILVNVLLYVVVSLLLRLEMLCRNLCRPELTANC